MEPVKVYESKTFQARLNQAAISSTIWNYLFQIHTLMPSRKHMLLVSCNPYFSSLREVSFDNLMQNSMQAASAYYALASVPCAGEPCFWRIHEALKIATESKRKW